MNSTPPLLLLVARLSCSTFTLTGACPVRKWKNSPFPTGRYSRCFRIRCLYRLTSLQMTPMTRPYSSGLGYSALQALLDLTRSEEHTSELQSHVNLVCRLLLEKKKKEI